MATKRKPDSQIPTEESDQLIIRPLGSGQEVGRSCHILEFKGKKIMLDCGIHPGLHGFASLPFLDLVDIEELDLVLVSHFHLDHCGGLPYFLEKTGFKGRCFMTHASKAIYRWLLSDYVKVSNIGTDDMLYTDKDIENSMQKIETVNFHQERAKVAGTKDKYFVVMEVEVGGVKFWCYTAGHVLGAAMFMIEIAGVKVLYTGDFSCQEDRHLCSAEIPNVHPDVVITESTYGTHIHEDREDREARFTGLVHDIVTRGGRCLIPVFALGRAQELLLILDEYWGNHPELHDVPIYYASSLAKKCMSVYQTYINAMNERIRKQISTNNPFVFKHISNLKSMEHFEDSGPSVVLASPGMMQSGLSRELFESWCTDKRNGVIIAGYCVEGTLAKSGLSRELFESWCTDKRNGVIIAGYCVEGTLAKQILSEPEEITTMAGQKLPLKCSVDYISFSAHTDYKQTSGFLRTLKPTHVVLVHGEQNEMARLKAALLREYEDDTEYQMQVYNPRNTVAVELYFRGEKTAKVVGSLAAKMPQVGEQLSGILVKRNFNYHIMAPSDLSNYTELAMSTVTQRLSIKYTGPPALLQFYLTQLAGDLEKVEGGKDRTLYRVFKCVNVVIEHKMVIIEWLANPVTDMYADAVITVVLRAEADPMPYKTIPQAIHVDKSHIHECMIEMLSDMFGKECIGKMIRGNNISVTVEDKQALVNVETLEVKCDDPDLQPVIQTAVTKLYQAISPVKPHVPTALGASSSAKLQIQDSEKKVAT